MRAVDFHTFQQSGENVCVEFKRGGNGAQKGTFETICAFLNRFVGDVFLGVADDGEIVGVPHGAVEPITPENVRPVSKNPIIAAFFKEIGRADELGSGTRNLYHYTRLYSGVDPVIDEEDAFSVTVPLNDDYSPEVGMGEQSDPPVNLPVKDVCATLTKSVRTVLIALKGDSSLTYDALAAKLKLHRDTIRVRQLQNPCNWRTRQARPSRKTQDSHGYGRVALVATEVLQLPRVSIASLVKMNLLRRVGSDKTGHWEVVK